MIIQKVKYFLAALLAAIIWGFFSIPLRSLKAYPTDQILHYRVFTSVIITWLIILIFRNRKVKGDLIYLRSLPFSKFRKFVFLTLFAGILITGNWFGYIYAVNNVSLQSAAFAYMVCPLLTAIGGFLILNEELTKQKLFAISIAVVSIVLLAQGSIYDVMWSVVIAILYALYLIIQRVFPEVDKFNTLGLHLLIATVLIVPIYFYTSSDLPSDVFFWSNIFLISIVFTIIPLFLSLYALIGVASSTVGIIIYINPIVAFAVAFFYFHEIINPHQVYAYCLLFFAVIIFNWQQIKELFNKPSATLASYHQKID